ncbi:hypothetical protein [Acidisphaera sp. L21]|uniref:hypothetical protein n=1 Tax=Acidisphaera sp. L21 TaxID=1641851 RepID=UPI00131BD9F5|nr:hypothetical protein [Acidisphaera sp. L21]
MTLKAGWAALALAATGCVAGGPASLPASVQAAAANYPPMILGGNVHPTDGHEVPPACAAAGTSVAQKGGPDFEFLGADPSNPELCVMKVGGETVKAWFDIWVTDWPGADDGHAALRQVINGPSGSIAGFDTSMTTGNQWHDLVRNDGVEDIALLGKAYRALKISHYREGANGNNYRSVSTIWKDFPSGVLLYGTYQHIAGRPEIDDPLIPTAIVTGK